MIKFNADETFEMAEQIEVIGAKFYRKAAQQSSDAKAKDILSKLAEMEDRHKEIFAAMRRQLTGVETKPTAFDPDGEAALYLQAFVDGRVFSRDADPSAKLTGRESIAQVLSTAIGLEKDSIVFYLGIKQMVPAELGKGRLDDIIREEMGHIRILSQAMPQ